MRKTILIVWAAAATLLLTECAEKTSPGHTRSAKQTPEEELAAIKTRYTPEQIAQGQTIFTAKCGDCHELKQPAEFTIKQWGHILPGMSDKAKLNSSDAGILRAWVFTNAKA